MMAQSPDRENVVWNQKLLIFGATLTAPTQLMETTSCLSHTLCAKIQYSSITSSSDVSYLMHLMHW